MCTSGQKVEIEDKPFPAEFYYQNITLNAELDWNQYTFPCTCHHHRTLSLLSTSSHKKQTKRFCVVAYCLNVCCHSELKLTLVFPQTHPSGIKQPSVWESTCLELSLDPESIWSSHHKVKVKAITKFQFPELTSRLRFLLSHTTRHIRNSRVNGTFSSTQLVTVVVLQKCVYCTYLCIYAICM